MGSATTRPWEMISQSDGLWLLYHDPEWPLFAGADWLSTIMSVEVSDRYHAKQGRSIGRWTLSHQQERLVVYLKRHFQLPRLDAWRARLFPWQAHTPGLQEWLNLRRAAELGVRVPRTVAAGEFRRRDGQLQGFIAIQELHEMLALHEAIPLAQQKLSSIGFAQWKAQLFSEVARLSWVLHSQGYFHQDLYLCHFYISVHDCESPPESWLNRVAMIDFHRFTRVRFLPILQRWKDLAQLFYSTYDVAGITESDRDQLWQAYQQLAQDRGFLGRWLATAVNYKAQRYYRHNLKATV